MSIVLHNQAAMQRLGNCDVYQRRAGVPSVGDELGERDLGIVRYLSQIPNEVVILEEQAEALVRFVPALHHGHSSV